MKFSLIFLTALTGSVLASPYQSRDVVESPKELKLEKAQAIFNQLYGQVQEITSRINATAESITSMSTAAQNSTAAASVAADFGKLNDLIVGATSQITALGGSSAPSTGKFRMTMADPKTVAVAALASNTLTSISGTINKVKGTLGLGPPIDAQVNKLVGSLSGLLLSLKNVLDDVLELVKTLVDGLLSGLSGGLAVLTLPKDLLGKLGDGLKKLPGYLGSLGSKGKQGYGAPGSAAGTLSATGLTNATAPAAAAAAPPAPASAADNTTAATLGSVSGAVNATAQNITGAATDAMNVTRTGRLY